MYCLLKFLYALHFLSEQYNLKQLSKTLEQQKKTHFKVSN